jgi:hypothetical protein
MLEAGTLHRQQFGPESSNKTDVVLKNASSKAAQHKIPHTA